MSDEVTPLAETMTGFGLFVVGVLAEYLELQVIAATCFATVGLIACARSYTRSIPHQYRKE